MAAFQEVVQAHFYCNGAAICGNLRRLCEETPWRERTLRVNNLKNVLLPELESLIRAISSPEALAGFDLNDKKMMKELVSGPVVGGPKDPDHSLNGVAFQVVIPAPVQPGGLFCVSAANQHVTLRCPEDAGPGMTVFFRMHIEEDEQYHFEMLPLVVKPPPTPESALADEESGGAESEDPALANDESSSSKPSTSNNGKAFLGGKGKKLAKFFSSFRKKSNQPQPEESPSLLRSNNTMTHNEEVYA
jgi:hypothetical protein